MIQCRWYGCPYTATTQSTVPAPDSMGKAGILWLCPGHEVKWQVALGSNLAWVNYDYWAPIVGVATG